MFLSNPFPYSTSFRNHFLIASILSFIVVFILVFLQPFGSNNFSNPYKNLYFIGYGVICFIVYIVFHLLSKWYYESFKIWKWVEELFFCILYLSVAITLAFIYTEVIINKRPEHLTLSLFLFWFKHMFLGFGLILFVLALFFRHRYASKKNIIKDYVVSTVENEESKKKTILLQGTMKKEIFEVVTSQVIYVKSEDNYIIIFYKDEEVVKEKILRNTLSNTKKQLSFLLQTHRSYLVNPKFMKSLKGNSQNAKLLLENIDNAIPVSKTYFESVKKTIN
ncbi:LytTR family DNA-binding domain-containing protein [Aquimarina algiphila]|uniref:LytTR family DNA-binding domain-containing protein n=1 Tax=Aquimarina algiphila TaxID=2047982 RepID=UPI00232F1977|nr:LytTR family DNA-binding domain-containing protein [Aquimarina algiphila]